MTWNALKNNRTIQCGIYTGFENQEQVYRDEIHKKITALDRVFFSF